MAGETIDFVSMHAEGVSPADAAARAAAAGVSRLEIFKSLKEIYQLVLEQPGDITATDPGNYPSPGARHAATVGLGAIVYSYPDVSLDAVRAFDEVTGLSLKIEALAMEDRVEEALAFYDRMHPERLELRPLSAAEARAMAGDFIQEVDGVLRVQDESTQEHDFGWVFLFQSAAYLDTGDFSQMIAGNSPFLIDRFTGAIWVTGVDERPDHYVDRYRTTGSPHG